MMVDQLNAKQRRVFDKVFYPFAKEATGITDLDQLRTLAKSYIEGEKVFSGLPLDDPPDALIEELMDCDQSEFSEIFK